MYAFLHLVNTLITIFIWLLIAQAILSWLLAFELPNRHCGRSDPSSQISAGSTFRR